MRTTFIITSAINVNVGIYTPTTRVNQTHETINSILEHFPDAFLVLIDGGRKIDSGNGELLARYAELAARCHGSLFMGDDERIQHLQDNWLAKVSAPNEMTGTVGLVKSLAEMTLINEVLEGLRSNEQMQFLRQVDRIFKISGRYKLSPLFDPVLYQGQAVQDKYVFRHREPSPISNAAEVLGTTYSYASRLWSFPPAQLGDAIERVRNMILDYVQISQHHYVDVEHLLFKHFHTADVVEVDHTHVMGTIAPNGVSVYD